MKLNDQPYKLTGDVSHFTKNPILRSNNFSLLSNDILEQIEKTSQKNNLKFKVEYYISFSGIKRETLVVVRFEDSYWMFPFTNK